MINKFDIKKNPFTEEYLDITEAIEANEGYCCCALNKTEDTKCMCKEFKDSENTDFCHCGRYYKVKNYETLAVIGDISNYSFQEEYIAWCERLSYNDFIVYGIMLNIHDYHHTSERYANLNRAKIAKADAVIVVAEITEQNKEMITNLTEWAERLGKKVLTKEALSQ